MIYSIVSMDRNSKIGNENSLPWVLKDDLKFFQSQTKNQIVIMGRKTWDSLPKKPLSNRLNIIISSSVHPNWTHCLDDEYWVNSPERALKIAENISLKTGQNIFVIGGEMIYNSFIDRINIHLIAIVETSLEKWDASYPKLDPNNFNITKLDSRKADSRNEYDFTTFEYRNKIQKYD